MKQKEIMMLVLYGLVPFLMKLVFQQMNTDLWAKQLGSILMSLPRPVMMVLMAVPEQLVMAKMEPSIPLVKRLLVSVAMYVVHFAWNGMVMKPERSYNELVWILGTALYALQVLGVKQQTAIALIAADSAMTLSLRGLG